MAEEDKTQDKSTEKSVEDLKAELEALRKENETLKKTESKASDDDDLHAKATKGRQNEEESKRAQKSLEKALRFTMGLESFVKDHKDLLPSDVEQIVKTAEKESYDSALEKSNAVKAAFLQSFFSVQGNVDLLTPDQKDSLEEYLRLTKTGKEQKAADAYQSLLEPALEMRKRLKKAEELGKANGGRQHSSVEAAYLDRLVKSSRKTHLGEKGV